ncbi:unnamed protein product [Spirodela intermedia]|uniref:GrpE protein homolog n=1 Tax=Spirodela intermedia TaxID=51605 RepID=A0A7I8KSK0_SPIIN|nr:unnamed protein product [Spirodela intermedia]
MAASFPNHIVSSFAVSDFFAALQTVSIDEDNLVQGGDSSKKRDQKGEATLKFLIQAYREAILSGDMESITSIELEIQALEKKRDELAGQVKEMTTEITTGKEKFLRLNADFENFRKRSEKDRLSFTSNIQRDVIESLLPIVDSFERARQQLKPETEKEKKIDTSYQGIYKQFVEILRSLRVAVVQTVGSQFDPSIHEAVGRVESQKFKEGVVVEEISRGFVLGDRVLRPAKVRVSAGAGTVAANDANPDAEGPTAEAAWPAWGRRISQMR